MRLRKRRRRSGALWTILYRGTDPFGGAILPVMPVLDAIGFLCRAKLQGLIDLFSAHDDDLVPWDPNDPEDYLDPASPIHQRLAEIKALTDKAGLPMHMITCSLHGHPVFAAGGFTNRDPAIRILALKKSLRAAWIGNYFGATYVTYWTARDGFECHSCDPMDPENNPYVWLKQALNIIAAACKANKYSIKYGTIEPKDNEPRGVSYIPLVGSALAFIAELDDPEFWGVNPEVLQHPWMGGQDPYLEIKQALRAGKLFFLHLGGQIPGQFDNDFPMMVGLGRELMVKIFDLLYEYGWDGVLEFDCHPLRSDLAFQLSPRELEEIFGQFLLHNVTMVVMVEAILVPRLRQNGPLQEELKRLNLPRHSLPSDTSARAAMLALPPAEAIPKIMGASVPVVEMMGCQQQHLAVDHLFTLALFGVTEEELSPAMVEALTSAIVGSAEEQAN